MKNVKSQVGKHVMDRINQAWGKITNHVRSQVNSKVLTQVGLQGNGQMRNQVLRNIKL